MCLGSWFVGRFIRSSRNLPPPRLASLRSQSSLLIAFPPFRSAHAGLWALLVLAQEQPMVLHMGVHVYYLLFRAWVALSLIRHGAFAWVST